MNILLYTQLLFAAWQLAAAQFPDDAVDAKIKSVDGHPGVSISYKETRICETQARAWAGYVHMPSSYLSEIQSAEPYNISMFFWYFEARNDRAQASTGLYLAGGPGAPSINDMVSGTGSCYIRADSNSTENNPWSWNNDMNMLYIDQPVSTGFSYTEKIKSTLNLLFLGSPVTETGITPFEAYGDAVPDQNSTFLHGTFSEQNPQKVVNSTTSAAKVLWHFSQAWFSGFPEYHTANKRISIWGNSYGGFYVPTTAAYIMKQNTKIQEGKVTGTTIQVDTVGWTNGCVDMLYQGDGYPEQAYNNTYGLQVLSKEAYEDTKNKYAMTGGCRDQMLECRHLSDLYDPEHLNTNETVTQVCVQATLFCFGYVLGAYDAVSNRSVFDMAHLKPDPYPPAYADGFFNQAWVQKELGVPVNFTASSLLANNVFLYGAGDPVKVEGLESVEYLLDHGVKVAMIYGDRDYRCPWNGAEKLSLALRWQGAEKFRGAGYEHVKTKACSSAGVVRQHGNLSFVRIFDAGHNGKFEFENCVLVKVLIFHYSCRIQA